MVKGTVRQKNWINIFDGKQIKNIDSKTKLNARLARAAVIANEDQIEKEWQTKDHEKLLKNIFKQAEKIGYLKSPSFNLRRAIKNKIQWLAPLLIGGSFFSYAMKDGIHVTDVQNVPNTKIEVTETFWDIVMDETGNRLIAFWPAQKKQITTTTIFQAANCSSEQLTLDGCLKLQNKHQAQFNIGLIYEQGLSGVVKNPEKAYEWYKKSAAQGNQRAKFNIEYMISKKIINK